MIIRTTRTIRTRKTNPVRTARTARRTVLLTLLTAKTTTKRTTNTKWIWQRAPLGVPFCASNEPGGGACTPMWRMPRQRGKAERASKEPGVGCLHRHPANAATARGFKMYKILIIEDDHTISNQISKYLSGWGYETACAKDFENILSEFTSFSPQLVLLDIGLPFYNGYYWCGEIRKISQVPVIFVSSAADNMNIVMAINMGGDDFVVKPFDLEVLLAKVQAILRRTYSFQNRSAAIMEHGNVILNLTDMSLLYQGKKLELSKNEFRILQLLYEKAGGTVGRDSIMKRLWDNECFVDDNTLTVNINRLRKKLEEAGIENFILTKKGVGYQLREA